mgnify:CR=1 FL=1|tara:strand:- start:36136 stop:36348 length:213 start_codon:yes stop_codon:yes gene_type:complete
MTEKRQITFLEPVKIGRLEFEAGDIHSFAKGEADQYINAGWAKCTATEEVGVRVAGHTPMQVDDTYVAMQ